MVKQSSGELLSGLASPEGFGKRVSGNIDPQQFGIRPLNGTIPILSNFHGYQSQTRSKDRKISGFSSSKEVQRRVIEAPSKKISRNQSSRTIRNVANNF